MIFSVQVKIASDGHPELFAAPVVQLATDFPLRPLLLGNLVPHQINMWTGVAPSGKLQGFLCFAMWGLVFSSIVSPISKFRGLFSLGHCLGFMVRV